MQGLTPDMPKGKKGKRNRLPKIVAGKVCTIGSDGGGKKGNVTDTGPPGIRRLADFLNKFFEKKKKARE